MNVWERTVDKLKSTIQPYDYMHWIAPIVCHRVDHQRREIVLGVPDASHAHWLEEHLLPTIAEALAGEGLADYGIVWDTPGDDAQAAALAPASPADRSGPTITAPAAPTPRPELIARYRFESFVDGPTNQFALNAARAVADGPGTRYNPLFIYGGVGLGKTHLLHAIGHEVAERNPRARIRYVTSETFLNDFINAIRTDSVHDFRRKYRDECDLLLVDDIQFLAGKDRTEEEFFHVFNTLHSSHRQIVLTSDQPPRTIPDMEDRLKSRLEWGLIADVKPPGLETRVAILKRKADADGCDLPDEVAMLLARHIVANVRELEGALMRLEATARIFGTPITIAMTREVLGDLVSEEARRVSPDAIIKAVAADYRLTVNDLKGPKRHRNITVPRQVAMHLVRELTDGSLPQIGQMFGGRDHTTVINALKRIELLREADPELKSRIERLRRGLTH